MGFDLSFNSQTNLQKAVTTGYTVVTAFCLLRFLSEFGVSLSLSVKVSAGSCDYNFYKFVTFAFSTACTIVLFSIPTQSLQEVWM